MKGKEDSVILIDLARSSIKDTFERKETVPSEKIKKKFSKNQGVFVTITKQGKLRGCIGYIQSPYPLYEGVIRAARAAAFDDTRFPEIKEKEFSDLSFEVSILSVPEKIEVKYPEEYIKNIKVGRDGLIIRSGYHSGLLLPQVAPEWGWDEKEFLEHTCMKAGLSKDAWKDKSTEIYKFHAELFSEK